jgi:hypothetical protein
VEHWRRGVEASGMVREAVHHRVSGATVGQQKQPKAVGQCGHRQLLVAVPAAPGSQGGGERRPKTERHRVVVALS